MWILGYISILLQTKLMLNETDKLLSVGYKTISINERNINNSGDIHLSVQLSMNLDTEEAHSLSTDLGVLLSTGEVSDLIIQAGERQFRVHKNILATRSPVFAQLISELEAGQGAQVCHSIVEETEEDIIAQTLNTDDHDTKEEIKETNHDRAGGDDFADCDEKVLDTEKEEKMKKLVITDLSPQTVGHILNYIYTDSMDNIDTVSPDLLAGSDLYQVIL